MSEIAEIPRQTPRSIAQNLRILRRKIFQWFFVDGAIRVLAVLLLICAVSYGIDRFARMDRPQRGVMLVLGLSLLCWVAWRKLVCPLFSRLSDDALVLEVERQSPEVREELISALEFSRMDWSLHPNASKGMVASTIAQGAEAGGQLDFSRVLRGGKFLSNSLLLALLAGIVCLGAIMIPRSENLKTWFNRNVLLGSMQWPQDYFFDIDGVADGELLVPRGDDWPVIAKIRDGYRSLPDSAKIEFRSTRGTGRTATMDPGSDGDVFFHTLRSVTDEFDFRISTKKVTGEWVGIKLVERPTIDEIALEQRPPDYTGEEASILEIGSGPYYLLRGSRLDVRGKTSKPLAKASLKVGDLRIPLVIDGTAFSGSVEPEKLAAGTYFLEIEDLEQIVTPDPDLNPEPKGLSPREPAQFKIRLREDTAPEIDLALRGVSTMIVPRARLPFTASVEDDYSITDVQIGYQIKADRAAADDITGGDLVPAGIAARLGDRRIDIEDYVELEPLEVPVDSRLSITMRATDNDSISEGGPKVGNSTTIHLRVVSESELRHRPPAQGEGAAADFDRYSQNPR